MNLVDKLMVHDSTQHYLDLLVPVLILNPRDNTIFQANHAACQFYGYAFDEMQGMPLQNINAEGLSLIESTKKELFENLRNNWEFNHRLASGDTREVEVFSSPVVIDGLQYVVALVIDVHEKRLAQGQLKESEERYRLIFEHSQVGISRTQMDGKVEFNKTFGDMLGYSVEEMKNISWPDITTKVEAEKAMNYLDKLSKTELDVARFQKRLIHKDGHLVDVDVSSYSQRNAQGQIESFIATAIDISELKAHQESLNKKMTEMELLNSLSIDRELQMIHLKHEVNQLLNRLGEKEKYLIVS